jgi:alkaline phosphatase D
MRHRRPLFAALLIVQPILASLHAQPSLLRSGPMVGYSEMTEVMLWAQTTRKASVQFRVWPVNKPDENSTTSTVTTRADEAFVVRIPVSRLTPGTRYAFEILIDGKSVRRPYPLEFQTQTLWHWRTDPPAFTAAIGSCFYINEKAVDRPGTPYGSDERIVSTIAAARPDLMLWLGDNTYYREVDWNTAEGLRYRWTHTRSLPELQPLLGSVHHYYVWDDHDFGPNDADRSYRLRSEALAVHKLFTANGTYGTFETPGVFGRFEWADVEFFLLDDRFHRAPNATPEGPGKVMFGPAQLQWLKDALLNSRAPFKIVANGNQVLNPLCEFEGLVQCRAEYDELLAFIRHNRIPGVVFVSGDRHMTELINLVDSTFYPLYDFTSSSLTAGLSRPRGREVENPYRVPGTLVADVHNFGLLHFSGPRSDRALTMECRDADGKTRWTKTIRASDLRPPRR